MSVQKMSVHADWWKCVFNHNLVLNFGHEFRPTVRVPYNYLLMKNDPKQIAEN